MWEDNKVVLDYLPGNTGDIRWLPSKHIDIRPQKGNERTFLFVIEGGADSESTINASSPAGTFFTWGAATLDLLLLEHSGTSSMGVVHSEGARFLDSLPEFLQSLVPRFRGGTEKDAIICVDKMYRDAVAAETPAAAPTTKESKGKKRDCRDSDKESGSVPPPSARHPLTTCWSVLTTRDPRSPHPK